MNTKNAHSHMYTFEDSHIQRLPHSRITISAYSHVQTLPTLYPASICTLKDPQDEQSALIVRLCITKCTVVHALISRYLHMRASNPEVTGELAWQKE
jgi:hypothetical protein